MAITSGTPNSAGGPQAWCGDPQRWSLTAVDLGSCAGQTVQLGFRVTSDAIVGREGWHVDDVVFSSCVFTLPLDIFADSFASGGTTSWFASSP